MNKSIANYPMDKTIINIFEDQVKETPNNIAVKFEDEEITYSQLNSKVNILARKLRDLNVQPNDCVGLVCERSIEMIIAIYAVVKSGAAYVPIDPSFPEDRIKYMLNDCKAKVIVTYNSKIDMDIEQIDLNDNNVFCGDDKNLKIVNKPDDLLYVIYTSGTTGRPKGVMVCHRNLISLLKNDEFQYDFNEKDVWIMFHSYCFDFSVWEMYGATLNGSTLIILPKEMYKDLYSLADYIEKNKVTVLNQVPSAFYLLMECDNAKFKSVRYLIFGGESLNPRRLKQWHESNPQAKIVNMYGITETTIHATFRKIGDKEIERGISDIGKVIPNLNLFILDDMELCKEGQEGEICISGAGVAKGYLNRDELTKKKFIDNPFGEGKLYRSGDLGRYLSDGNIEYLGRIDDQVKVRGYRIELGEIENAILNVDGVRDAKVIVRKNNLDENEINGYIMSDDSSIINKVREELKTYLPEYMIPSKMMIIESYSMTSNGKLDKNSLPEIKEIDEGNYVAPTTELEEELVDLWKEMLEIDVIGINDNFIELGGHSLIANRIVYKINETYDVDLSIVEFLTNGLTVKGLAEIIEDKLLNSISDEELQLMLNELDD